MRAIILSLFFAYSLGVVLIILVLECQRKRSWLKQNSFKASLIRDSQKFGSYRNMDSNLTNYFIPLSNEELSYWDKFSNSKGYFVFPSLTLDQALDFSARRAGFTGPIFTELRKLIFL